MRFACWIAMAVDTHSEYVILTAFPHQQLLRELASISRYAYEASLVVICHIYSLRCARYYYWSQRTPLLILFTELALFRVFCSLLIVWLSEVIFLALWRYIQSNIRCNGFHSISVTDLSLSHLFPGLAVSVIRIVPWYHAPGTSSLKKVVLKTRSCPFARDRHAHWTDRTDLLCYVCLWTLVIR